MCLVSVALIAASLARTLFELMKNSPSRGKVYVADAYGNKKWALDLETSTDSAQPIASVFIGANFAEAESKIVALLAQSDPSFRQEIKCRTTGKVCASDCSRECNPYVRTMPPSDLVELSKQEMSALMLLAAERSAAAKFKCPSPEGIPYPPFYWPVTYSVNYPIMVSLSNKCRRPKKIKVPGIKKA